jgi:hypothetical protein
MQPTLFPVEEVDRDALAAIAARSVPRSELHGRYCNCAKSSDMFELGYTISHWIIPGEPASELLEYNPLVVAGVPANLPRVTATSYADQVAIHEAIGARVVGPGKRFSR